MKKDCKFRPNTACKECRGTARTRGKCSFPFIDELFHPQDDYLNDKEDKVEREGSIGVLTVADLRAFLYFLPNSQWIVDMLPIMNEFEEQEIRRGLH
jgi:hypothetical protein